MEKELSDIEAETREEVSKDDLAPDDSEKEFDASHTESKDVEEEKELNLGICFVLSPFLSNFNFIFDLF